MEQAFGYVIVIVTVVSAIIAIASLGLRSKAYEQIGANGLNDGTDRNPNEGRMSGAMSNRERDEEVRQMLAARNERRVRRGLEPLDVESELARLTAPALDPALEAEVRELVVARNERRVRRGREPLDVETEVKRQIAELGG